MGYLTKKLMITSTLLMVSGVAIAQDSNAAKYGKVGGMNAANALACGATQAQVDKLRERHKMQVKTIFGTETGFDRTYDLVEAQTREKIVTAWTKGQYSPPTEVCNELMRQVRSSPSQQ